MPISNEEKSKLTNAIIGIEKYLNLNEYKNRIPLCYKATISIKLNWNSIFEYLFNMKFENVECIKFAKRFYKENNKNKLYKFEDSFFNKIIGKNIIFDIYKDEMSGLTQNWSYYYNRFVDNLDVIGLIFNGEFVDSLEDNKINNIFNFNPSGIYISSDEYKNDIVLDSIPFHQIMGFLKDLYINNGNCMKSIKKFPTKLQGFLDKNNIVYTPIKEYEEYNNNSKNELVNSDYLKKELDKAHGLDPFNLKNLYNWVTKHNIEFYLDNIEMHEFESKYYILGVKMEFFKNFSHSFIIEDEDYSLL